MKLRLFTLYKTEFIESSLNPISFSDYRAETNSEGLEFPFLVNLFREDEKSLNVFIVFSDQVILFIKPNPEVNKIPTFKNIDGFTKVTTIYKVIIK